MSKPTDRRDVQKRKRFAKERPLTLAASIEFVRWNVSQRWQRQATRCINAVEGAR
jgi:hypothetical protein